MGIVRSLLDLGTWYSKWKYHHAEKYGNNVQGKVGFGGLVYPAGSLYLEGRGGYGSGLYNLEVVSHKGDICWKSTTRQHEESRTAWSNIYGAGVLGMGDTIFTREGKKFTDNSCPNRGLWFGKFTKVSKLRMGVTKKQYLGVTSDMVKGSLVVWDIE